MIILQMHLLAICDVIHIKDNKLCFYHLFDENACSKYCEQFFSYFYHAYISLLTDTSIKV